ncbi:SgcJ/EcaC family oxidoreductase [Microbacterium sp. NPDC058342]|uniref:SgcJ/EcaC family oxidoreductase n=1 Tax=Microbacterium sp. NPDC058342 TaxID=3346454 RepID=UPI003656BD9D
MKQGQCREVSAIEGGVEFSRLLIACVHATIASMQQSIDDVLGLMVAAWDAGDAKAYADLFTEDATYVTFIGTVSRGRAAIARDHEPVLTRFQKGSRMSVRVTDIRFIGTDLAIVVSEGGIGKRDRIKLDKVQTFVFKRGVDGRWLCAAFQNSKKNKFTALLAARSGSAA